MVLFYIKETISKAAYHQLYVSEIEIIPKLLLQHTSLLEFVCSKITTLKFFQIIPNWSRLRFCIHTGELTGMFWGSSRVVVEVVEVVTSSDMRGAPPSPYNCLHSILGSTVQTDFSLTTALCWCPNTSLAPGQLVYSVSFSSTSTSLRQTPSWLMKISSGTNEMFIETRALVNMVWVDKENVCKDS